MQHNTSVLSTGTIIHHYPCPSTPKASMILQHGFGDYSERWNRDYPFMLHDLHSLQFDVYAMDMHGHGRSPGQRSITHVGKAVEDHISLRRQIAEGENSHLPIYLLGHSLGGLVTASSATRKPEKLAGVILVAPVLPFSVAKPALWLVAAFARFIPTWQVPLPKSPVATLSRDEELIRKWCTDENVFHGHISNLLASTALDEAKLLWDGLQAWQVPTLVIHGDKDTYTEYLQSEQFVARIASSDKEFCGVNGGLHDLFSDDIENWRHIIAWVAARITGSVGEAATNI